MQKPNVDSIDGGNSTIKVLVDGTNALQFENTTANSSQVDYRKSPDLSGTGIQKLDVTITRQHNKKDSTSNRILLGKLTEKYKAQRTPRADIDKSNDPLLIDSMIATLAYTKLYFMKKSGENISKTTTLRSNLGSGLPFHEWIKSGNKEKFKQNLVGNHKVKFNHPWFEKNGYPTEVEIIIDYVKVCVEGETTANLLLNTEDNEFQKLSPQEQLDIVVVLIDIGAYTTEIIGKQFVEVVENEEIMGHGGELCVEHQTLANLSDGIRRGIGHIMEATITSAKNQYAQLKDKLVRQDIELALSSKGERNGKVGWIAGTEINILDIFTEHAKDYANEIAQKVAEIYDKNEVIGKIKKIYLTGGGSQITIIVEQLKKALGEQGIKAEIITPISDPNPVFSNCEGYYWETVSEIEEMEAEGEVAV
jgi:hypothetical protein